MAQFTVTPVDGKSGKQACTGIYVAPSVEAHTDHFTPVPLTLFPFLEWIEMEGLDYPSMRS